MEVPMEAAKPPGGAWAMAVPTAVACPLPAVPVPSPTELPPAPPFVAGPTGPAGGGGTGGFWL